MLPGLLITGAGVGMVLPSVATAIAASLPPARFATGSAVLSMSRQVGAVLGVAALVAILGTVRPSDPVGGFDRGWVLLTVAAALAAIAALAIGEVRQHQPAAGPARADATTAGT
jgi:MFS family permease